MSKKSDKEFDKKFNQILNNHKLANLQRLMDKKGLSKQIDKHWQNQKDERKNAEKQDKIKPIFLRAKDIEGKSDTFKTLTTTLGGVQRPITEDDLKAFQHNIKTLQEHYTAGITAQQVLDLSLPIDIDRANKQIKFAIPRSRRGDVVHFITDASGENGAKHHFVNVQFNAFTPLKLMPNEIDKKSVQKMVRTGGLRFECDCGRFQYWYRYLNSIAGTCYGRQETGYPKIRNPNLVGVACKHILRTMKWIVSTQGEFYLQKELEKARHTDIERKQNLKKSEVQEHLANQLLIANNHRRSNIRTASDKKREQHYQKMKSKSLRMTKQIHKANQKSRSVSELKRQEMEAIKLLKSLGYTVTK